MYSFPIWPQRSRQIWSNIFKIFYNLPPTLDIDGYDSILENSQALADLAEELQSSEVVSRAIHTSLLSFDQQLFRLISLDPVAWTKLAVQIQSAPIFQESMIHLVGKWGLINEKDHDSLPKSILSLCNQKIKELSARKRDTELRIVNTLPRPRSDHAQDRETNKIYRWMALTFYQQWLCQSFAGCRNYNAPDGGAAFYRAIATGGDAYINQVDQEISRIPATPGPDNESTEGLKELKRGLDELKNGIKEYVSDLVVNEAKYDAAILGDLPYLTCCKVSEDEMPPKEASFGNISMEDVNANPFEGNGSVPGLAPENIMAFNNNNNNNFTGNYFDPVLPSSFDPNHNTSLYPPFSNAFTSQTTDPALSWGATAMHHPVANTTGMSMSDMNPTISVNGNNIYQPQQHTTAPTSTGSNTNMNKNTQFHRDPQLEQNIDFLDVHAITAGDDYLLNGDDGSMAFL